MWIPGAALAARSRSPRADDGNRHYLGAHFHSLRRTSATALVGSGIDVKTARHRLGHSSPVLTLALYAHANERMPTSSALA